MGGLGRVIGGGSVLGGVGYTKRATVLELVCPTAFGGWFDDATSRVLDATLQTADSAELPVERRVLSLEGKQDGGREADVRAVPLERQLVAEWDLAGGQREPGFDALTPVRVGLFVLAVVALGDIEQLGLGSELGARHDALRLLPAQGRRGRA